MLALKETTIGYQIKINSGSNLTHLIRRFAGTNEALAKRFVDKRFAVNLNKHFGHWIGGEITKLLERFDSHIDCQVDEKTAESKAADIDYQFLHFAEAEMKIAIVNEVDTDQKYPYCYHSDFKKHNSKEERHSPKKKIHAFSNHAYLRRSINHVWGHPSPQENHAR